MEVRTAGSPSMTEYMSKGNVQLSRNQHARTQGSVQEDAVKSNQENRKDVKDKPWQDEGLTNQIGAMNELIDMRFTSIQFERHDTLDRTIVRVIDRETDEVIKEIPPKEFLDMISSMLEFAGIIVDKKI